MTEQAEITTDKLEPVFANQLSLIGSGIDLTLIFGRTELSMQQINQANRTQSLPGALQEQPPTVRAVQAVTIPIGAAKDLLVLLSEVVGRHEATFGQINTPFLKARAEAIAQQQQAQQNG